MIKDEANKERESRKNVSTGKRVMWGMGGFTDHIIIYGTVSLVSVIYVNGLHFSAAMVGLAVAVPRIFDAISDPVIGYLSDNTRSRWGRRRPWMLAGLVISAILTMTIWHPPVSAGPNGDEWIWPLFFYLAVMISLLYAVGYTMFNVPHIAMGYEMTTDYDERTHLFKWRQLLYSGAGFLTPWLLPLCMFVEGDKAQALKGSEGVLFVSAGVAVLILLSGLPSVLFCKEGKTVHTPKEEKVRFLDAIKFTLHNKPFWLIVVSNFISKFCMAVTGIFFMYVFLYYISKGDQKVGAAYMAIFFNSINITCLLAMPLIAKLAGYLGKKRCLLTLLVMSSIAYLSLYFTFTDSAGAYMTATLPFLGEVSMQWPCLITGILIGVFTNTMPMINNSMLADVCDLDELNSGHRREAFFSAVFSTADKLALGVAMGLQGFLLVASGFDSKLDIQDPATIKFWLLALVISQPIGFLIAMSAIWFYPLTKKRCAEIRNEIDARSSTQSTSEGAE